MGAGAALIRRMRAMAIHHEPAVSVVTPVYNGAPYLRECIESVLAQTYTNWEYTIVNNCSTDDTLAIAEEYAKKDRRIRVHSNDVFLDVIANHNLAFRLISPDSKYCKVVSADDWIFPECIARMVGVADANPSIGIVGSYQLSGGAGNWQVRWDVLPYPGAVLPGKEICRHHLLGGPHVFANPTCVLYRSDLIRVQERFFPHSRPGADTSACYKYLQYADFGFVHQVLSYERVHESAITTNCRSLNSFLPDLLQDLMDYGPIYLTPDELNERINGVLATYYRFLAASVFHFRDKTFWNYHKQRFADSSQPLSRLRLATAICAKLADLLLNPKQTLEKALKRTSFG